MLISFVLISWKSSWQTIGVSILDAFYRRKWKLIFSLFYYIFAHNTVIIAHNTVIIDIFNWCCHYKTAVIYYLVGHIKFLLIISDWTMGIFPLAMTTGTNFFKMSLFYFNAPAQAFQQLSRWCVDFRLI